MSEVTFAKAFLTTLDKRAIKLPADHVSDPKQYPNQSPYILPKQSHPYPKKSAAEIVASQQSQTISVSIKPMRGSEITTLDGITLEDSIYDIKTKYAQRISTPVEKIKLLLNKKPAADLKTLKDLGVRGNVDMSAMIMGAATSEASPITTPVAPTPPEQEVALADKMEVDSNTQEPGSEGAQADAKDIGPSGPGALHTTDFWADLEAFLSQRLRDTQEAKKLAALFKDAWAGQQ